MNVRKIAAVVAVVSGSLVSVAATSVAPVSAAPGDGLRPIDSSSSMTNACNGLDASTSGWTWAKPSLEYSTNNGTSYTSASGSQWGFVVCRTTTPMKQYWFIIGPSTGSVKDMGTAGLASGLQFKVTIPAKSGDTTTYASGYSSMVSYTEQSGSAVVEVKPAGLSKINMDTIENFKSRHPECATYTTQTINKCSVVKADEDLVATVIQHVGYSDAPLTSMEETMKGLWVGANVNSFQIGMSCPSGMSGASAQSAQDTITVGGKTYTRITLPDGSKGFRGPDGQTYTESQLAALTGGSSGGDSSGGSTSAPELKVSMEGTPHFKSDGATLNKGSMKIFIPKAIATKCFGTSSSSLADIAKQLTLTRSEATEGTSTPSFTSVAVTTPVEGIVVSVAEMTFSNPDYTLKSLLRAASAGSTTGGSTTGGTTTGGTTGGATSSVASLTVKGSKATISVKMAKAGTIKIYRKLKGKTTLVKTLKAKAGTNRTTVSHSKGAVYTVRSSTGKVIATLK